MSLTPNAVDLAVARVREGDPKRAVRLGTATRLFIIDPWAMMNQPLVTEALALRDRLYVEQMPFMDEADADSLAANFAVTRRPGQPARGTVRLFFAEPVSTQIATTTVFKTADGVEYAPVAAGEITVGQMRLNYDGQNYYWDVEAEAIAAGELANVAPGAIALIDAGPSGVVSVTNPVEFVGGKNRETNAQLQARIKNAISLRAFVTKPGIETIIGDAFNQLTHIIPIGKLDPEMTRDLVSGTALVVDGVSMGDAEPFHAGGMVDLYIRSRAYIERMTTLLFANGQVRPRLVFGRAAASDSEQQVIFDAPFLDVVKVQLGDPVTGICTGEELVEGVDYALTCETPGRAYSTRSVWVFTLLESSSYYAAIVDDPGKSVIITYLTNSDVAAVQAYADAPERRNLCEDVLVKAMPPVEIDVSVTYCPKATSELTASEAYASPERVTQAIREFLWDSKHANGFDVDELYRVLYGLAIKRVSKPLIVRTQQLLADGTRESFPEVGEYQLILRTAVASLQPTIRVSLPGLHMRDLGVSRDDTLHIAWTQNGVEMSQERTILGLERKLPTDTDLSVLVLDAVLPTVTTTAVLEIRRRTVSNIASVPRTSTLVPRNINALAVAL